MTNHRHPWVNDYKTNRIQLRVSQKEKDYIYAEAKRQHKTVSNYIRNLINQGPAPSNQSELH